MGYTFAQLLRAPPGFGGNRCIGSDGIRLVFKRPGAYLYHPVPSAPAERERHLV